MATRPEAGSDDAVLVDLTGVEEAGTKPARRRSSAVSAAPSDPDVEIVLLDDEDDGDVALDKRDVLSSALQPQNRTVGVDDLGVDLSGSQATEKSDPDVCIVSPPEGKKRKTNETPAGQAGLACVAGGAAQDVLVLSAEEAQRVQPSLKAKNRQLQRELERMKRLAEELSVPVPAYWQTKQDGPEATRGACRTFDVGLDSLEADRVLRPWAAGGIKRDRVFRIERIENHALWRKYWQRKTEVARERPQRGTASRDATELCPVSGEEYLFHGAHASVIDTIVESGFDVRVSNLTGLLGAGVYFAQQSLYSDSYSAMAAHDHETQTGARGRYGAAAGNYPRPPNPPAAYYGGGRKKKKVSNHTYQQQWSAYQQELGAWLRNNPQMVQLYPHLVQHAGPHYVPARTRPERYMLLCRVVVGEPGTGAANQRRPQAGKHSAKGPAQCEVPGYMVCMFENAQAYPEYRITYEGVAPSRAY